MQSKHFRKIKKLQFNLNLIYRKILYKLHKFSNVDVGTEDTKQLIKHFLLNTTFIFI